MYRVFCALAVAICCNGFAVSAISGEVTPPEKHLGRPVGVDFQLADWNEVKGYFEKLDRESPRVQVAKVGVTTEGRDFLLATISSEENLSHLDRIKEYNRILADPRGCAPEALAEAIRNGKPVLMISCAMHSTEAGAPQFSMEFAYKLAASDDEPWVTARKNTVVVLIPTTNPDGLDHVVAWYRQNVGTPYETAGMVKLYQHYTGHDNNRDWFMLTQAETRIVTHQLYSVWRPQVYWDVHQQGSDRERMFIPPFRDPLNPTLDPGLIAGIDALGSRALMDMTRKGLTGISTGVNYDMWYNCGNRMAPLRHNIISLLTEAASVRLASPIFLQRSDLSSPTGKGQYGPSNQFPAPWPGGWWRLRDIIDYELAFGESLLGSLGREPEVWLRAGLEAAQRNIQAGGQEGLYAWIIPADNRDPAAARRLIDALLQSGVEIHASPEPLTADGRTYPAGSVVIFRGQPYGAYVKDLFDIQRFPEGHKPYDITGWTLPLLMGVRRVEVFQKFDASLARVEKAEEAVARFVGDDRAKDDGSLLSSWDSNTWKRLAAHLQKGQARFFTDGARRGLFALGGDEAASAESAETNAPAGKSIALKRFPRVGVYAPWSGHIPEGWLRYVLDDYGMPFVGVRNETLRAGNLSDFLDVLILPDVDGSALDQGRPEGSLPDRYTGGLAPEGAAAIEDFVARGGTLIALDASAAWAIELFQLPLIDATREKAAKEFSCPGSVLRAVVRADHPLTAGLPDSLELFFSDSRGWRAMTDDERKQAGLEKNVPVETLLEYAPTRLLLSGYINQPEVLEGRMAWAAATIGQGRIHLFGFQPHYRAWSQATFPLLFRAMLLDIDSTHCGVNR